MAAPASFDEEMDPAHGGAEEAYDEAAATKMLSATTDMLLFTPLDDAAPSVVLSADAPLGPSRKQSVAVNALLSPDAVRRRARGGRGLSACDALLSDDEGSARRWAFNGGGGSAALRLHAPALDHPTTTTTTTTTTAAAAAVTSASPRPTSAVVMDGDPEKDRLRRDALRFLRLDKMSSKHREAIFYYINLLEKEVWPCSCP